MDKKNKNPNVPNLRFNEFSLSWHQMRIIDLLSFQNGINGTPEQYGKGIKYISVGDILNNDYITYDKIAGSIDINQETLKNYSVTYGDILFQRSSEIKEDIGRTNVYLDKDHTATFGGFVIRGKKIGDYNPTFFNYLLKSPSSRQSIVRLGAGAQHYNIGQENIKTLNFYFPDEEEQQKIANLFSKIDERIQTQIKIIDTLLSEINSIRSLIFNKSNLKWIPLKDIVAEQDIKLKRGKVIPKHKKNLKYIYPVYSSSITNSGLMGYSDSYMFNQELITWSIDGGGNFFYRKKHKFNITNVSGYMILNENLFNYQFIVQSLIWQHEKLKFDYQTKAHPSVVESLYKIPIMDLEEQHKYACLFSNLNEKYELELHILDLLNMQKKYLLKNMFV